MKISKIFLLIPLLANYNSAFAKETPFYAGIGYGTQDFDGQQEPTDYYVNNNFKDTSSSFDIYAGYQLNQFFSVEAGYSHFGKASDTYIHHSAVIAQLDYNIINDKESLDIDSVQINSVFEYPMLDNVTISAYLGLSYTKIDSTYTAYMSIADIDGNYEGNKSFKSSENDFDLTYGIGVRYDFTNRFSGKLQWKNIDNDVVDISGIHLSIETHF
ncbi:outer membrane beta-barrel protein [Microbulbifer sp. ZKSA004]|uniref:outer membrane beta-barrel protein n=1 Tax=Microbulbifer sp. ZKSA004 TaxID=3243389 RepID=UPI004039E126